jgi:hypothetical protein
MNNSHDKHPNKFAPSPAKTTKPWAYPAHWPRQRRALGSDRTARKSMNTPNKCQRPLLAKQPASQGVGMQTLSAKVGKQMAKGAELDALIRQKLGGLGYEF